MFISADINYNRRTAQGIKNINKGVPVGFGILTAVVMERPIF
jgi:hypothetical protein